MSAKQLGTILALIGSIVLGFVFIDDRHLSADDHVQALKTQNKINKTLKVEVRISRLKWVERDAASDLYFEQSQLRQYPNNIALRDKVIEKEEELKQIRKELNNLKSKRED